MNSGDDATGQTKPTYTWLANPVMALVLLFTPAVFSIINANSFADWLYDPLLNWLSPLLEFIGRWPALWSALFGGDYGLVAMLPFLLLYALPTVLVFAVILSVYRSTGVIDLISTQLHPYLKHVGISGQDLVRVVMGFGCNVPAVVSSRGCDQCSRGACISAISFGAACSYQLPATFAVFSAAGYPEMGLCYLLLLTLTTLIYLRFTTPKAVRFANRLKTQTFRTTIQKPNGRQVWADLVENFQDFIVTAFPIFVVICFGAALLDWTGVLSMFTKALSPVMGLFNLPGEAATAVVLGSVRKDGIAIGLLNQEEGILRVALETPVQALTAVYLAGVLLPCIVTVTTIVKEMRWKFALLLCGKQMLWASAFSLMIAWGGALFV